MSQSFVYEVSTLVVCWSNITNSPDPIKWNWKVCAMENVSSAYVQPSD
jgi:hypothetical protein